MKGRAFKLLSLLPAALLFTVFMVYPTLSVFYMSLFRWGGFSGERTFVAFENYKTLFGDERFLLSLKNQMLLIITVTAVTLVLALWCANTLTRERIRGRGFFRVVLYIPNILSAVVIAAIFSAVFDPSLGLINSLLGKTVLWLGDRKLVLFCIAAVLVWQAVGYYSVMYMSAISQISESQYEAARLEGAGRWRVFFSVTLPQIMPTVRITLTFFIISTINMSFLIVRAMTGGGPDGASEVFLSYMYRQAYTNSAYGYGMAIGVVVFTLSFAMSLFVNRLCRGKHESL